MPIDDFSKIDEEYFTTILEEDFYFEGDFKIDESVIIKGEIKGTIESNGTVIVGPLSKISADIRAKNLECFGSIKGNVIIEEGLYFHNPSTIIGNITALELTVEKGCRINGKITMLS